MDRKTLVAIALCFLIFVTWDRWVLQPRLSQVTPSVPQAQKAPLALEEPEAHSLSIRTALGEAFLGDRGSFLTDFRLKDYTLPAPQETTAVTLGSVTSKKNQINLTFDSPDFRYLNQIQGDLTATPEGARWTHQDAQVKITREFIASENQPYIDVNVHLEFQKEHPRYAFLSLHLAPSENDTETQERQWIYWTRDQVEDLPLKKASQLADIPSTLDYIGASNHYFLLALIAQGQSPHGLVQPHANAQSSMSLVYSIMEPTLHIPLRVYFGPKEIGILKTIHPHLGSTLNFGWFAPFAHVLLATLQWLYPLVRNYGIAIILLTLFLKLITYPLTYKSMKNMKKMARLQPELQKIREEYASDKQQLNIQMLHFMKKNGYSPMAGCFPMLIQMPIFFTLYKVLYGSVELYHAPFMFWITDLSTSDPYYITPILGSLAMVVQQKLTPNTATDPAQAKMMQFMPLIFGVFMLGVPAGLALYMLTNTLASIVQQIFLNRRLNA